MCECRACNRSIYVDQAASMVHVRCLTALKSGAGATRADALRAEMCRLASWSQCPQEIADALMAAVLRDNDMVAK